MLRLKSEFFHLFFEMYHEFALILSESVKKIVTGNLIEKVPIIT